MSVESGWTFLNVDQSQEEEGEGGNLIYLVKYTELNTIVDSYQYLCTQSLHVSNNDNNTECSVCARQYLKNLVCMTFFTF